MSCSLGGHQGGGELGLSGVPLRGTWRKSSCLSWEATIQLSLPLLPTYISLLEISNSFFIEVTLVCESSNV